MILYDPETGAPIPSDGQTTQWGRLATLLELDEALRIWASLPPELRHSRRQAHPSVMRRISFAWTEAAFLSGSKTQTRRIAWRDLEGGTRLLAVRKSRGLKKGERQHILGQLWVTHVRRERLDAITLDDVAAEGSPGLHPDAFVKRFCRFTRCTPSTVVTVISFRLMEPREYIAA